MIDIKDAYEKAKLKAENFSLLETRDSGDMWIFIFGSKDRGGKIYPGAPNITVHKQSGETGLLTVPPVTNLKIINNAKIIETSQLKIK